MTTGWGGSLLANSRADDMDAARSDARTNSSLTTALNRRDDSSR